MDDRLLYHIPKFGTKAWENEKRWPVYVHVPTYKENNYAKKSEVSPDVSSRMATIGSLGGSAKVPKGFAKNRLLAREAGRRGGRISRKRGT